jgi:hypothetical protein
MMNEVRLEYDDQALDIIDKMNRALFVEGLRFEDDGEEHDGFMILNLVEVEIEDLRP